MSVRERLRVEDLYSLCECVRETESTVLVQCVRERETESVVLVVRLYYARQSVCLFVCVRVKACLYDVHEREDVNKRHFNLLIYLVRFNNIFCPIVSYKT